LGVCPSLEPVRRGRLLCYCVGVLGPQASLIPSI